MPFDERLLERIQTCVVDWDGAEMKRMFGGVCFLLHGRIFCGVHGDSLILRLGAGGARVALDLDYVQPCDITGRPMTGWVMVPALALRSDETLADWLRQARDFVLTLPPGS